MAIRQATFDSALGVNLIVSAVIHLAVFLLLFRLNGQQIFDPAHVQETYYVDVVNLPVASPRAGSPTQRGNDTEAPSLPVPEKNMALPAPRKPETLSGRKTSLKPPKNENAKAESYAFAEKMAKLQGKTEAQRQEAAFERLRRRVAATGSGRSGMPGGTGTETGSRYEDYIKSRLEDALKVTSSFSTANPVVVVRLTIGANGRIARPKLERSSGDHAFELAVLRAIEIVGETLTPPPNHKVFESGFIFKPREISNSRP